MSVSFYKKTSNKLLLRRVVEIILICVAVIALWPEAKNLWANQSTLSDVSYGWLFIGFLIYMVTPFLGSASFIFLSKTSISYLKCTIVQLANGFVNRILPSGSGAIATSSLFLKKSGVNSSEAITIALLNNLVGFIAFLIVMLFSGALSKDIIDSIFGNLNDLQLIAIGMIIVSVLSILIVNKKIKKRFKKWLLESSRALIYLIKNPLSAAMALASNIGITIIHLLCLIICLHAVGFTLPLAWLALVFAAGIATTSVSPTPNGLGLTEVAMTSALENYGIPSGTALLVVLSYRLITFWTPILPGLVAFKVAQNKKII